MMRALVLAVVSVALVATAGCKKSATCKNAAEHYVDLKIKEIDDSDERKEAKKERKEMIKEMTEECEDEKISKKTLACVIKADSTDDAEECIEDAEDDDDDDRRAKRDDDDDDEDMPVPAKPVPAPPTGGGILGGGGATPVTPPSGGTAPALPPSAGGGFGGIGGGGAATPGAGATDPQCEAIWNHVIDITLAQAGAGADQRKMVEDAMAEYKTQFMGICPMMPAPAKQCMLTAKTADELSKCGSVQ